MNLFSSGATCQVAAGDDACYGITEAGGMRSDEEAVSLDRDRLRGSEMGADYRGLAYSSAVSSTASSARRQLGTARIAWATMC